MVIIMFYIVLFLLGFGLSIIGFIYIITYLNYLAVGYSTLDYLKLVVTRKECLLALIGIIIMITVIFKKR